MAQDDYYQILGVRRSASLAEIKRAFRSRVLETHPDRHADSGYANEATRNLIEAYKVLTDPGRRKFYDIPSTACVQSAAVVCCSTPPGYVLTTFRFLRMAAALVFLIVAALCLAYTISANSPAGDYTFANIENVFPAENEVPDYEASSIIASSSAQEAVPSATIKWVTQPPLAIGELQTFPLRPRY